MNQAQGSEWTILLGLVAVWAMLALVGLLIGRSRGRGTLGLILGLVLGPVGWLITALLPKREQVPGNGNTLGVGNG